MSDKQLTVAELLAKAGKDGASTSAPRTRRRRSMDTGGISVAELTGNIPKVNAKPQEARHSSEPIDVEDNKPEQLDVATLQEAARKEAESRLQPKQHLEQQAEPEPEPVAEPEPKVTQFEAITVDRPSNAETIVLSVVDEDAPLRLTTDTFSRVESESLVEAPAEDLAKPVDTLSGNTLLTMAEESLAEAIDEAHTTESAVVEEAAALVGPEPTVQFDPFEEEDDYSDEDFIESDYEDVDDAYLETSYDADSGYDDPDYDEEPATAIFDAAPNVEEEPVTTVDEFANTNFRSSRMAYDDETVANLPLVEDEPEYLEEDEYEQDYQEEIPAYPRTASEPAVIVGNDYDQEEDEEEEKMSIFAVLGMSLIGILFGAGIFYGFQYLWGAFDNRMIVAGLAGGVTLLLVTIVHFMRTDRDILSKVLAFLVGIAMTFGPLLIVGF